MPFVDTHCHLNFSAFDLDRHALLDQCAADSIQSIVVPGVTRSAWASQLAIQSNVIAIKHAIGLHPCFLQEFDESGLLELEKLLDKNKTLVAVGEIGLDKLAADISLQTTVFEAQIKIAKTYNKPVIIHVRKMHSEILSILRRSAFNCGGVIHAFSGSLDIANAYIKLGFKLGIGGVISYQRANKTRSTVASVSLTSLVLETDAPDMPVFGHQGERNSPIYIREIFEYLCELRSESADEIEAALFNNSCQLFGSI